jgi:hypothetical protein
MRSRRFGQARSSEIESVGSASALWYVGLDVANDTVGMEAHGTTRSFGAMDRCSIRTDFGAIGCFSVALC